MAPFALVRSLKRQHASQVAGFVAVAIAAAALIGEWAGLPLLSSWGSGLATTKPVAALCLTALGLALVHPGKNSRFAFAVGLAVAGIGVLDLFSVDFGMNRWLVPRAAVPRPGVASFEMINGMPLAIALAGGSLALSRFEGHPFTATVLGGLAGIMAIFAVLTYLTGIHACCDRSPRYCRSGATPARLRPGAGTRRSRLGAATYCCGCDGSRRGHEAGASGQCGTGLDGVSDGARSRRSDAVCDRVPGSVEVGRRRGPQERRQGEKL
jgi:hypothetical protein